VLLVRAHPGEAGGRQVSGPGGDPKHLNRGAESVKTADTVAQARAQLLGKRASRPDGLRGWTLKKIQKVYGKPSTLMSDAEGLLGLWSEAHGGIVRKGNYYTIVLRFDHAGNYVGVLGDSITRSGSLLRKE
jgi:hypothetical protein